jgi:hypothetical protein
MFHVSFAQLRREKGYPRTDNLETWTTLDTRKQNEGKQKKKEKKEDN